MTISAERLKIIRDHPYPVSHKRKVPFSPWITVPDRFEELAANLQRLDSDLDRHILGMSDYEELLTTAVTNNIHRSISLEGNPLTLQQVKRVTRRTLTEKKEQEYGWPGQEVVNHLAVHLNPQFWGPPWTLETLQRLHRFLLTGTPDDLQPGAFRTVPGPGEVVSSSKEVVFRTAPAEHIVEELESLLRWRNGPARALSPVVGAAIFFHEFESIHPFVDGNGRTGRVLFHMYLQTEGLPNSHLCLIEPEVMHETEVYYEILSWTDHCGEYADLIDYYSSALTKSYEKARDWVRGRDLSGGLDEFARRLYAEAKHHGDWFSVSEATNWVSGCGTATVRDRLNVLVEKTALEQKGNTKSRRYRVIDFSTRFTRWQADIAHPNADSGPDFPSVPSAPSGAPPVGS